MDSSFSCPMKTFTIQSLKNGIFILAGIFLLLNCGKKGNDNLQGSLHKQLAGNSYTCLDGHGYPTKFTFQDNKLIQGGKINQLEYTENSIMMDGTKLFFESAGNSRFLLKYEKDSGTPEDYHCQPFTASNQEALMKKHKAEMAEME